jgi:hypothetical protein
MYRQYLCMLLGLCGIAAVGVWFLAIGREPLTGDLARVGGYGERQFGWNGVEERFSSPLAEPGRPDGDYGIVVIGDSFSSRTTPDRQTSDGSFWTDFLANDTGLPVGVFDIARVSVDDYLASPGYRHHPARLVILELAERTLRARLGGTGECPTPGPPVAVRLDRTAEPLVPGAYRRALVPHSLDVAAGELADSVRKDLLRDVLHLDTAWVLRLPLSRSDLFSSRAAGELLIFADDRGKADWTAGDWDAIRCRLLRDQRAVTGNGATAFLFALVPDKSIAYAAYLHPAPWLIDATERLAEPPGLNMPRLDVALRAAIAAGTRDVYLPDDSHWSTAGSRIATKTVLRYLRESLSPAPAGSVSATASR